MNDARPAADWSMFWTSRRLVGLAWAWPRGATYLSAYPQSRRRRAQNRRVERARGCEGERDPVVGGTTRRRETGAVGDFAAKRGQRKSQERGDTERVRAPSSSHLVICSSLPIVSGSFQDFYVCLYVVCSMYVCMRNMDHPRKGNQYR